MKKNKLFHAFVRGFIKSALMMVLMLGVGFLSYKITMGVYQLTHKGNSNSKGNTQGELLPGEASYDDVSKNLIYVVDKENARIDSMVLEILNTNTNNLDFVTIPADSEFTISSETYQKLYALNSQVPQIIKLSEMVEYFPEETVYEYGAILVEDMLGVDLSYYTVLDKDTADTMFEEKDMTQVLETGATISTKVATLKDSFLQSVDTSSVDAIMDFITDFYDKAQSNLPLSDKKKYAQTYSAVNKDYIYYHSIIGVQTDTQYDVDSQETSDLIQKIIDNSSYEMTQSISEETQTVQIPSTGLNITLLNGSQITGLASTYSATLENAGFDIAEIGNYSDGVLEETKILVREQGMGTDLIPYFKKATVEVSELPIGTDIQIILGVSEGQ
ncbi:MAG TPA: LytR C-terminal domain-containing protein [Lachnospiraceae bacterium]|nr:LytR C-terminal domain-containing protein [Lachnospiraceae bacterium]